MKRPYHTACPKCREQGKDRFGDNLYCYSDGHDYCFSCGYWKDASIKDKLLGASQTSKHTLLPSDTIREIPNNALEWLSKYEITSKEVLDYGMLWSPRLHWLIFPIYADSFEEVLLGYQARNFAVNGSKYYTRGSFESIVNYYGDRNNDTLILVEDMISAIKVARQHACMPLFGSFLTDERGRKLKNFFKRLVFWLDYDKAKSAFQQATRFKQSGFRTSIIITTKDPKEYSDEEITSIVDDGYISDRPSGGLLAEKPILF